MAGKIRKDTKRLKAVTKRLRKRSKVSFPLIKEQASLIKKVRKKTTRK